MKQIKATRGNLTSIYRFSGRKVYVRVIAMNEQANQIMAKLREEGTAFQMGTNWLQTDVFEGKTGKVVFNKEEIDLNIVSDKDLEDIQVKFYVEILKNQGFATEVEDLK